MPQHREVWVAFDFGPGRRVVLAELHDDAVKATLPHATLCAGHYVANRFHNDPAVSPRKQKIRREEERKNESGNSKEEEEEEEEEEDKDVRS